MRASLSYYKELLVFRSTPEREQAAWEFARWLVEPEQQAKWTTRTGYLPVNRTTLETDAFAAYLAQNERLWPWLDELNYVRNFPLTPVWGQLLGMFETALGRVRQGEAALVALSAVQPSAQAILDELAASRP